MLEGTRARIAGILRGSAVRLARAAERVEGDNTGVISPPETDAPDVPQDPVTDEARSMLLGGLPLPAPPRGPADTIPDETPPAALPSCPHGVAAGPNVSCDDCRRDAVRGHGPRVRVFRP